MSSAWFLRQMIQWYYRWIIDNQEDRLKDLKKEKKRILDRVMDTETYKVAKELLEQFDPSRLRDKTQDNVLDGVGGPKSPTSTTTLRYRQSPIVASRQQAATASAQMNRSMMNSTPGLVPQSISPAMARNNVPSSAQLMSPQQQAMMMRSMTPQAVAAAAMNQQRLARPILPRERGMMDKLVDFVVGDGPSNRYALICRVCGSHNGMALKEEFEYVAFRCCYCMAPNHARKQRPFAPRLVAATGAPTSSSPPSVSGSVTDDEREKTPLASDSKRDSSLPPRRLSGAANQNDSQLDERQSTRTETESEPELIDADEASNGSNANTLNETRRASTEQQVTPVSDS